MSATNRATTLRAAVRAMTQSRRPFSVPARVVEVGRRGRGYTRVRLVCDELLTPEGLQVLPADGIKLSLPAVDGTAPAVVEYTAKGPRWPEGAVVPISRALTISEFDPGTGAMTCDVIDHPHGALADWLKDVEPGQQVAVAGLRCEFAVPDGIDEWLIVADPSAFPAAIEIIGAIASTHRIHAVIEAAHDEDRSLLPAREGLAVTWSRPGRLRESVAEISSSPGPSAACWIAAERDVVKSIRRDVTDRFAIDSANVHASAYWFAGATMSRTDELKAVRYAQAIEAGLDPMSPEVLDSIEFLDDAPSA